MNPRMCCLLRIDKVRTTDKTYMSVSAMTVLVRNKYVYYESIKRELKTKLVGIEKNLYECRCDERQTKKPFCKFKKKDGVSNTVVIENQNHCKRRRERRNWCELKLWREDITRRTNSNVLLSASLRQSGARLSRATKEATSLSLGSPRFQSSETPSFWIPSTLFGPPCCQLLRLSWVGSPGTTACLKRC